jgi:hypothetical protein
VREKPCEKRRKVSGFQCEEERKPCTFFNRALRLGYIILTQQYEKQRTDTELGVEEEYRAFVS